MLLGGMKKKNGKKKSGSFLCITFPDTVCTPSWFGGPTPELSDYFCNTTIYTLGVQQV